jgi:hypothetical protein
MKIGDSIKIVNQPEITKKIQQFPELKDKVKYGGTYKISKVWTNAIPETLYGLEPAPDCGFTENELKLLELSVHFEPRWAFGGGYTKTFEGFKNQEEYPKLRVTKSFNMELDSWPVMDLELNEGDIITIVKRTKRYVRFYIDNDDCSTYTTIVSVFNKNINNYKPLG